MEIELDSVRVPVDSVSSEEGSLSTMRRDSKSNVLVLDMGASSIRYGRVYSHSRACSVVFVAMDADENEDNGSLFFFLWRMIRE